MPSTPIRRSSRSHPRLATTQDLAKLLPASGTDENALPTDLRKLLANGNGVKRDGNDGVRRQSKRLKQSPSSSPVKRQSPPPVAKVAQRKPKSPSPPKLSPAQQRFAAAKSIFRLSHVPAEIATRTAERRTISAFLQEHALTKRPGSLYISGQPGSGKTALVERLLDEAAFKQHLRQDRVKVARINCAGLGNKPQKIFDVIYDAFGGEAKGDVLPQLEGMLLNAPSTAPTYLIFLDEIDQLLTQSKHQDILYRIFEWPHILHSSCSVIGVANAMDLTSRFLPRLKSAACAPQELLFGAYQESELKALIEHRLEEAQCMGMFHPTAILYCSKRLAASGDCRKLLAVCRAAVEKCEQEWRKKEPHAPDALPVVTLPHVQQCADAGFGAMNHPVVQVRKLTTFQQSVVVGLVVMQLAKRQVTVLNLLEVLGKLAQALAIPSVNINKYNVCGVLSHLETVGLVQAEKRAGVEWWSLRASEEEVKLGVRQVPNLAELDLLALSAALKR